MCLGALLRCNVAAGRSGNKKGQLSFPGFACFVRRCGVHTVLICDTFNDRIVEISVSVHFIRHIAVDARGLPYGIGIGIASA